MVDGTSKIREAYRSCRCIGEFQAAITQIGTLLGCKTLKEVKWLQAILNDDVILYEEYLREEQHHQNMSVISRQQQQQQTWQLKKKLLRARAKNFWKRMRKKKEEEEEEEQEGGKQQCNANWNRKKENSSPKLFQMDEINN